MRCELLLIRNISVHLWFDLCSWQVIENMRKSPSLIPNGGSLEATAADIPDIVPHVEEPPVSKDVTTAEVGVDIQIIV